MSCQHGNSIEGCDECAALLSEYNSGFTHGKKDGWEACEACHGIVDGGHVEAESLRQQLAECQAALAMKDEALDEIVYDIENNLFSKAQKQAIDALTIKPGTEALEKWLGEPVRCAGYHP